MPIPLIVLGVLLLLFLSLLLLRVRVVITCREQVCVQLHILCLHFTLYPRRRRLKLRQYSKKRLAKAERKAAKKAKKKAGHTKKAPEQKRTLRERIALVRAISAALIRRTSKHLKLHAARLHIRVATGDAASTAILHGAVCASLSHLLAGLDRVTVLDAASPDVCVEPDFTAERSSVDVKIIFSIRVFAVIATALSALLARMQHKASVKKKHKNPPSIKKGA